MQIRWKCAHFLAFSGNACILCKLGENARILCKLGENARIFSGNACILCKLGENARILLKMRAFSKFELFQVSATHQYRSFVYIYERPQV